MNPLDFYKLSTAPVEKIAEALKTDLVREGKIEESRLLYFLAGMFKMLMESRSLKVPVDLNENLT